MKRKIFTVHLAIKPIVPLALELKVKLQLATVILFLFLLVLPGASNAQFCNTDLTNAIAPANIVSVGTPFSGEEKEKAFDNLLTTKWNITSSTGSLRVNLVTPQIVTNYSITSANDEAGRDPISWVMEGSNDGTNYTTLQTVSNASSPFASRFQTLYFNFSNTTAYQFYRWRVTANNGSSNLQISEMQFMGTNECVTGNVYNTAAPTGYPNVPVYIRNTTGTVANATTDAAGHFVFTTAQVPTTVYSVIVLPPTHTYFDAGPAVNLNASGQTAEFVTDMTSTHIWPNGAFINNYGTTTSNSSFPYFVDNNEGAKTPASLNWTLKPTDIIASACPFVFANADGNGSFGVLSPTNFLAEHPWQPSFHPAPTGSEAHPNLFKAFTNATTGYVYDNALDLTNPLFNQGVLMEEARYNVTSFLGTQSDGVYYHTVGNFGTANNGSYNLLNGYAGGWRQTYGHTTGDAYDQFLAVNGSTAITNNPLMQFTGNITTTGSYYYNFWGKNANAFIQGTGTLVNLTVTIRNPGGTVISSVNMTLPAVTTAADDDPNAAWTPRSALFNAATTGTYTFTIIVNTTNTDGNDFYMDDIDISKCNINAPIGLTGNVFNDPNAGNVNNSTGVANVVPAGMYAYIIQAGVVVGVAPVETDGTYAFYTVAPGSGYTVRISTTVASEGDLAPAVTLPTGWVPTGEFNGSENTGNTAPVDGISASFTVSTTNVSNISFGIEQRPNAGNGSNTAVNPGGTTQVTVPASTFTIGANSTDIAPGNVAGIRITAFPTGATTIEIFDGVTTTSYGAGDVAALTALVIPTDANGNPTWTITADPTATGVTTVSIPFKAIDNAGAESTNNGSAVLNFTGFNVSGIVHNDTDALTDDEVDGTGTHAGSLNAILVNNNGGLVAGSVSVSPLGAFEFLGIAPGTYSVLLSTNSGTVGQLPPPIVLPDYWVSTGEFQGTGVGNDLDVNTILPDITVSGIVTNLHLGIQERPTAGNGVNSVVDPGYESQVPVPASTFANLLASSDVAPGTLDSLRITAFPTGASSFVLEDPYTGEYNIYYPTAGDLPVVCNEIYNNCYVWPAQGITIPVNPLTGHPTVYMSVDPTVFGFTQVIIPFRAIDNAGFESANLGQAVLNLTLVCDLTPQIRLLPSVTNGIQQTEIYVTVTELNYIATNGSAITVLIPKNPALLGSLVYNTSLTQNSTGDPVANSQWALTETADLYIFTTNSVIDAGTELSFVFRLTASPGLSRGFFPLSVNIINGSGGEVFFENNFDAERLQYFETNN